MAQARSPKSNGPSVRSLIRAFLPYYQPEMHLFVADILCAFIVAGVDLAFPQILRSLTRGLFTEGPEAIMAVLVYIAVGLLFMYLVRYFCRFFVVSWGHIMGARMESRMRADLFDAYERMSLGYFDHHKSGDLMSRLVNDLFDISEAAHHGPEFFIIGIVEIVGSFVILCTINVPLTVVLALVTVLLVIYNFDANRRMRAIYTENRVRIAGVNARLEDSLAGIRVVKGFAAENVERSKFSESNEAYLDSKARMYRVMGNYQAAISMMMGVLNVAVVVMGGWLVAQGQMEAVDLATYALYISLFTSPITNILNFTETFQKALAGFQRFREVCETVPDILDKPGATDLVVSKGEIRYEGVRFSYNRNDEGGVAGAAGASGEHARTASDEAKALVASTEVIRGLDLVVEAGKTVALVGPSGGGKSTTCALLPRFYDVDAGRITIDGQDVRDVTQRSLRLAIGLVQQDVYLFDGTVAENIAYGKPSATLDEIRAAAEQANIAEFVESLPQGYETQVGQRGTRLSGGQKQRIAIARVFLKDPAILILDEATSALDNESEAAVQESLARLAAGRTTLVIAHRLSTIKGADLIATVEEGRVAELGTHDELMAKGGTYARYYRMQFE